MFKQTSSDNFSNWSESNLRLWLERKGLLANPFERWNADQDQDLPNYFVDIGNFDDLLYLSEPCVVFAARGCGKTAQRQMLAAHCRPLKRDSLQIAVNYTYTGFEQVLAQVNDDVNQVRAIHHINAILQLGVTALVEEIPNDLAKDYLLHSPDIASRLNAFVVRFTPQLKPPQPAETATILDNLEPLALLQNFAQLVKEAGLENCVVLIDGLDEFPLTADDPTHITTFLTHLLGTLPLIECPGLAFKFFLPQELEPILRARSWFRADRLRFFRLSWQEKDLLALINQRLTYFSQRQPPYEALGQLCEDALAQIIDHELIKLAQGLPRATLNLAGLLLQYHCEQTNPPELIRRQTWKRVKANWSMYRHDFVIEMQTAPGQPKESQLIPALTTITPGEAPVLRVEEDKGLVWLGERDITSEINPKEYQVLVCLYQHRDRVCEKDTLIQEAWSNDADWPGSDQTITQSITRLRKALKQFSPDVEYIETIRGRGYRLHTSGLKAPPRNKKR